ncbi:MAG: hypothetical protein NPIRA06_11090 [Nitrospirales bacterium]|nr:MAG: hypothetical protein NPIRA06_11090 [Nitrospirales bacterium]
MALNEHNRRKFVAGMSRRISKLRDQSEQSLDFAIETMFQERTEAYLHVEQGLMEVDRMLGLVEGELEDITELTTAQRLESRLEFIEDRFEEFESEIRQRPRRRRRKINLFNFFKAAGGGGGEGEPTSVRGEIRSSVHAYEVLGVEFGSPLSVVTRAFRERAKKIHPDIRQGDRSSEPELRRIIEAYQFLKTDYFGGTASDSVQRPF